MSICPTDILDFCTCLGTHRHIHTSDTCDLLTNTTHVTCVTCITYDTHMTSLMMPQPKHSNAPLLVSCMCTSNTLQTLSLVVCSYLIYDLRLPSSYNYIYIGCNP